MKLPSAKDIGDNLFIPFVILVIIAYGFWQNGEKKTGPMDYLNDIAALEYSLGDEFEMCPEDAIYVLNQYLFGTEAEKEDIPDDELESAFYLLERYYTEASALAKEATE